MYRYNRYKCNRYMFGCVYTYVSGNLRTVKSDKLKFKKNGNI